MVTEKWLPMYCPNCGTRYLKGTIDGKLPEYKIKGQVGGYYTCMFCRNISYEDHPLVAEEDSQ